MAYPSQNSCVQRNAFYFGAPEASLFGVFHTDQSVPPRDCVAVICQPVGFEYIHGHRSVRHLADALARQGVPALRFDYHGTGDSTGSDLDADRVGRWMKDIREAIDAARSISGRARVCLLGIRLGSALATMVSAEMGVEWLVLWFPVVSGRRYVREQKIVASTNSALTEQVDAGAPMEVAGFLLAQETQASLATLDVLAAQSKPSGGVLLIQRKELPSENSLRDHFSSQGVMVDSIDCPGYADMMAEPVDTVVPQVAIDSTVDWLVRHTQVMTTQSMNVDLPAKTAYEFTATDGLSAPLMDQACRFGAANELFGIYTRNVSSNKKLPAVVLLNSGVVHSVGANRVNELLARNLAVLGFPVFRFDLQGVGESVATQPELENKSYPDTAQRDIDLALDYLTKEFACKQYVVVGLCSGAYHAFMAAGDSLAHPVSEVVMINPPNLNWKVEGFLFGEFGQVVQYRASVRSGDKWMKLLKGQVNIFNLIKVVYFYVANPAKRWLASIFEVLRLTSGGFVAHRLRSLYARNRHVTVFCSQEDPGWDILLHGARVAVNWGLRRGKLTSEFVPGADHTFTKYSTRLDLVAKLRAHLLKQYGGS